MGVLGNGRRGLFWLGNHNDVGLCRHVSGRGRRRIRDLNRESTACTWFGTVLWDSDWVCIALFELDQRILQRHYCR